MEYMIASCHFLAYGGGGKGLQDGGQSCGE